MLGDPVVVSENWQGRDAQAFSVSLAVTAYPAWPTHFKNKNYPQAQLGSRS